MHNTRTLLSLLCLLLTASWASAENVLSINNPALGDTSRVVDIDEVVVTTQTKDAFSLRRQPVSSSSFDARQLRAASMDDLQDLSLYVPSFCMPDYGSRLTSSMYIRGIGSRISSPAVSVYVDDIPVVSKCGLNFHSYQTERIDVLRGPQATLYGQNSEGGLIRLYTKDPTRHQGTELRLGIGSRLTRNVEAAHYGRAGQHFAYSLAAFYNGTNGYLRNTTTLDRADRTNEGGARLKLQFMPTTRLSLQLTADWQHTDQHAFAYGRLDPDDGSVQSPSTNYTGTYRRHLLLTGLTVRYRGEGYTLSSTTSYQYLHDRMFMDQDYLPTDYMHLTQQQLQNAVTQEITVKSERDDAWHWTFGAFASHQWLRTEAPVFFGEGITQPIANSVQTAMRESIVSAMTGRFMATGVDATTAKAMAEAAIERAGGISLGVSMDVPGTFHTPQMNFGLFHETNLDLTPRLTLTLGLRYDLSRTQIAYRTSAAMAMTASVMGREATYTLSSLLDGKTHAAFNQLLPKIALSYRLNQVGSLYAIVSKGYRAGGYNIQMFSDILQTELTQNRQQAMSGDYAVPHTADDLARIEQTIAYRPETSMNYELGAHLNLAHHRLHLDLAAYLMQVRNLQLSRMAGTYGYGRMMVNAGRSRSLGVEATLRASAFSDRLSLSLGYGFTQSVFRDYADEVSASDGSVSLRDYRGKRVPYVPQHTLSATADYRIDLPHAGLLRSVTVGMNASAQGNIYWDEANTYKQPFYTLLGAHADLDLGHFALSLWGKNLTQTRYNTFAVSSAATGSTAYFAQQGAPFMCGVEVSVRF